MTEKETSPGRRKVHAPGGVGLLIIDMINDFAFEGGEALRAKAETVAQVVLGLRDEADRLKVPVIYVNDNFGRWRSERSQIVAACQAMEGPGRDLVARIAPRDSDHFVIKPQFSGFYATPLPVLLPQLGVDRLVLCGVAGDICVLFTAADAHMRAYDLWVPCDAIASDDDQRNGWALEIMRNSMGANIEPTSERRLSGWIDARA